MTCGAGKYQAGSIQERLKKTRLTDIMIAPYVQQAHSCEPQSTQEAGARTTANYKSTVTVRHTDSRTTVLSLKNEEPDTKIVHAVVKKQSVPELFSGSP